MEMEKLVPGSSSWGSTETFLKIHRFWRVWVSLWQIVIHYVFRYIGSVILRLERKKKHPGFIFHAFSIRHTTNHNFWIQMKHGRPKCEDIWWNIEINSQKLIWKHSGEKSNKCEDIQYEILKYFAFSNSDQKQSKVASGQRCWDAEGKSSKRRFANFLS